MTRLAIWIARPITLWAVHFIAVYALISAACGPRALLEPAMLRVVVSLVTLVPALLLLLFLVSAGRYRRRLGTNSQEATLAAAAYWSAAISLLAVLINVTPVAMLTNCTG